MAVQPGYTTVEIQLTLDVDDVWRRNNVTLWEGGGKRGEHPSSSSLALQVFTPLTISSLRSIRRVLYPTSPIQRPFNAFNIFFN